MTDTDTTTKGRPPIISTRSQLVNVLGTRGKFTLNDLVERSADMEDRDGKPIDRKTARATVQRLMEEGFVSVVDTQKNMVENEDGELVPGRGRPAKVYRANFGQAVEDALAALTESEDEDSDDEADE